MNDVHYSSATNEWATPRWLFEQMNREFDFDLDAASTDANALCDRHYTAEDNALAQEWRRDGNTVWLNCPYGRMIAPFARKAFEQTQRYPDLTVVLLIPARTDTRWWHECLAGGEVRFLKGRLRFTKLAALPVADSTGAASDTHTHTHIHTPRQPELWPQVAKPECAPFPSAVVILGAKARAGTTLYVHYSEPASSEGATEQAA